MYYDPSGHIVLLSIFLAYLTVHSVLNKANEMVEKTKAEEDPNKDYEQESNPIPLKLSDGTIIYYVTGENPDWNDKNISIKILDSWKYDVKQITEFAKKLKNETESSVLNVRRIVNEWYWHTIAFYYGYKRDETRSADICLDAPDKDHGLGSWIMNNCWWFY